MIPVFPQQKCGCHFCRETTIENNQLKTWPIWVSLKNFSPFDSAVWPAIADIYIYIYVRRALLYEIFVFKYLGFPRQCGFLGFPSLFPALCGFVKFIEFVHHFFTKIPLSWLFPSFQSLLFSPHLIRFPPLQLFQDHSPHPPLFPSFIYSPFLNPSLWWF